MRQGFPRSCGRVGRRYRTFLRDLVQSREVKGKDALAAILHIEKCDYCQASIELAIHRAEREQRETEYLESLDYTLQEAKVRLVGSTIGKEKI